MINEHLNHLNRRQSLYSGGSSMPYHAMPCHVARREGVRTCVRGQDKHEKRRSGDLPIVAPPPPYPRQARRCDLGLTSRPVLVAQR